MTTSSHLWAIGFDDMNGAHRARDEIAKLGWETGGVEQYLFLQDMAVVVRHPDGSFSLNREPVSAVTGVLAGTGVGFLIGLVLAGPLAGAAIGALVGGIGAAASASAVGIGDDFVREIEGMMRPGTSALFVLEDVGDLDVILRRIRSLGGAVLKTNVDRERAQQIQAALAAGPTDGSERGGNSVPSPKAAAAGQATEKA